MTDHLPAGQLLCASRKEPALNIEPMVHHHDFHPEVHADAVLTSATCFASLVLSNPAPEHSVLLVHRPQALLVKKQQHSCLCTRCTRRQWHTPAACSGAR